jgi:hypothetical protein
MRFIYGVFLGFLITVIGAILYLAFAGGDYLLVLSPKYQEMKTERAALERAAQQRDVLAQKLTDLEERFRELGERFADMEVTGRTAPRPSEPVPAAAEPAPAAAPAVTPVAPSAETEGP